MTPVIIIAQVEGSIQVNSPRDVLLDEELPTHGMCSPEEAQVSLVIFGGKGFSLSLFRFREVQKWARELGIF